MDGWAPNPTGNGPVSRFPAPARGWGARPLLQQALLPLLSRRGVRAQLPSLSTAVGAVPAVWVFAPPRAAGYLSYFSQSPAWRAPGVWSQGWWVSALVCHEQFLCEMEKIPFAYRSNEKGTCKITRREAFLPSSLLLPLRTWLFQLPVLLHP